MNTPTIAIHKTTDINNINTTIDLPVFRRVPVEDFTPEFQHIYENGDLYGVYQDESGKVVALDNEFARHENILL